MCLYIFYVYIICVYIYIYIYIYLFIITFFKKYLFIITMGPLPFTSFVFPLGNTTLNLNRILEWQKCPILPPLYSTGFSTMRRQILPFPSHPKYVYYFYLEYIYTYHLIFYTCLIYNLIFFFLHILLPSSKHSFISTLAATSSLFLSYLFH